MQDKERIMTNGEKILKNFPNATTRVCKNKGFTYIEVEQDDKWIADFDMEWWNAEDKELTAKNGISNKSIIYKAKESKDIQEDLDKLSKLNEPTTK